jgi:hypothetical protein
MKEGEGGKGLDWERLEGEVFVIEAWGKEEKAIM